MKDRDLIVGLLTGVFIVLLFMASAVAELSRKLDAATRLDLELVEAAKEQTRTQGSMIRALQLVSELTGILPAKRKAEKGWYEALSENVGREAPLDYPNGWADRYFNNLAREGALSKDGSEGW